MNTSTVSRRGPRTGVVLAGVLLALVVIVAAGFLFHLPFGFGGWELAIIATPVALAVVAISAVLRVARKR